MVKRGRKRRIDDKGRARAVELAAQQLSQKEIADRLGAEGYGQVTQQTVSKILCSAARVGTPRRTKVERRTPAAPSAATAEVVPGFESLSLRTLRTKLEQAEEMSRIVRESGDLVEWGRLARTITAIATKIEAREDALREREEARERDRQKRREDADAVVSRQGEALTKLRALLARQDVAHARDR